MGICYIRRFPRDPYDRTFRPRMLTLVFGGLTLILLAAAAWCCRATTLTAPLAWACATVALVAAVEGAVEFGLLDSATPAWRFVAAAATFCPPMAVLGAKRPQSQAWQAIVLSLWVVVLIPVANGLLFQPNRAVELHGLHVAFLVLLVVLGVANYLPTAYWPCGVLFGAAQCLLLAAQLPWPALEGRQQTAMLMLLVAALLGWRIALARSGGGQSLDRLWRDFTNAYGLVWGLRIAERVNAAATIHGWNLHATWTGLESREGLAPALTVDQQRELRRTLHGLLRRFVSPRWIAARAGDPPPRPADN